MSVPNCAMIGCWSASTLSDCSVNVKRSAITTVARVAADGELSWFCSSARYCCGFSSVRRPRHSATMLRVPSSLLSPWLTRSDLASPIAWRRS